MARWIAVALLILAILACGSASSATPTSAPRADEKPTVGEVAAAPTVAESSTEEPEPTAEPEPTEPPPPPEPIVFTGTGDTVTANFAPPAGAWIVEASHDGQRNFIVQMKDAATGEGAATLWSINKIGPYQGTTAGEVMFGEPTESFLEVRADGNWSITMKTPMHLEVTDQLHFSGLGDTVTPLFPLTRGRVDVELLHSGERNFIVYLYSESGGNANLANVIGQYSGTTADTAGEGLHFLAILADGPWTTRISQP